MSLSRQILIVAVVGLFSSAATAAPGTCGDPADGSCCEANGDHVGSRDARPHRSAVRPTGEQSSRSSWPGIWSTAIPGSAVMEREVQ